MIFKVCQYGKNALLAPKCRINFVIGFAPLTLKIMYDLLPYAPKIFPSRPHAFDAFIFKGSYCEMNSRCFVKAIHYSKVAAWLLKFENDIPLTFEMYFCLKVHSFRFSKWNHLLILFQSYIFLFSAVQKSCCRGYCIDLLKDLAEKCNFTYSLHLSFNEYGSLERNNDTGKQVKGAAINHVDNLRVDGVWVGFTKYQFYHISLIWMKG